MRNQKDQHNDASRKRGRRGNLSANGAQIVALGPIDPLDCVALNNIDWFLQSYGFLMNLRCPEKGYRSSLTPAMESHIREKLEALRYTPLSKFYIKSDAAQQELPDLQLRGIRLERAIKMSHALLRIARRDRDLVRRVVLGYCLAVSDRMRVEFIDIRDAKRGRELIELVKNMRLPWLGIRLVGYSLAAEKGDPNEWLKIFGLKTTTPIDYVHAQNQSSRSELGHIAIDVRNFAAQRNSREFLEVMLVAAATELWRCVLPQINSVHHSGMEMMLDFSLPLENSRYRAFPETPFEKNVKHIGRTTAHPRWR